MTMVWRNGEIQQPCGIDPSDRGLLLADGAFATLLVRGGEAIFLEEHLRRLREALSILHIDIGTSDSMSGDIDVVTMMTAIRDTAAANQLDEGDAVARITVSRGVGPRGLAPIPGPFTPTVMVSLSAAPDRGAASGRSAAIVTIRRNEGSPTSRLKTLAYTDNVLAALEAERAGAEEAILLNNQGRVACAAAANLILVCTGQIFTPPPSEGCRLGIARAVVLTEARRAGWPVFERPMRPEVLRRGVLLATNAVRGPYRIQLEASTADPDDDRTAQALIEAFWGRVDQPPSADYFD